MPLYIYTPTNSRLAGASFSSAGARQFFLLFSKVSCHQTATNDASNELGGNPGHKKGEEGGKKGREEERKVSKASLRFRCASCAEEIKMPHTALTNSCYECI
jgi:hypothetical protein